MMLSMLCWGSWANTQKIDETWPYTVNVIFAVGALATALPMSYLLMRQSTAHRSPFATTQKAKYLCMHGVWPEVCCWGLGTIANFVASYVPMIGPATSFAMGEGNTMISAPM
jgi:glucose uptake protein